MLFRSPPSIKSATNHHRCRTTCSHLASLLQLINGSKHTRKTRIQLMSQQICWPTKMRFPIAFPSPSSSTHLKAFAINRALSTQLPCQSLPTSDDFPSNLTNLQLSSAIFKRGYNRPIKPLQSPNFFLQATDLKKNENGEEYLQPTLPFLSVSSWSHANPMIHKLLVVGGPNLVHTCKKKRRKKEFDSKWAHKSQSGLTYLNWASPIKLFYLLGWSNTKITWFFQE